MFYVTFKYLKKVTKTLAVFFPLFQTKLFLCFQLLLVAFSFRALLS